MLAVETDDLPVLAGALMGAARAAAEAATVDAVWTGPNPGGTAVELTSAVVCDLIDEATETVLLVGYAVHTEPTVADALHAARRRGVAIELLLERPDDNPYYQSPGAPEPFSGLTAKRWHWPAEKRPPGASLHAKVLVVDEHVALVGSANITGAALNRNLECGIKVRGGQVPRELAAHVHRLRADGVLPA